MSGDPRPDGTSNHGDPQEQSPEQHEGIEIKIEQTKIPNLVVVDLSVFDEIDDQVLRAINAQIQKFLDSKDEIYFFYFKHTNPPVKRGSLTISELNYYIKYFSHQHFGAIIFHISNPLISMFANFAKNQFSHTKDSVIFSGEPREVINNIVVLLNKLPAQNLPHFWHGFMQELLDEHDELGNHEKKLLTVLQDLMNTDTEG